MDQWQITISDGNGSDTSLTAETPVKAVKALLCYSINHDYTDIDLYADCFELIEQIQDDPQDEYRISGGDISARWHIVLKPLPIIYDGTPIPADHVFEDDCVTVPPSPQFDSLRYRVDHELHRMGYVMRINTIPDRLWDLWSTQGQTLQQMANLCREFDKAPATF